MDATPRLSSLDFARGLMRIGHRLMGNAGGFLLLERGQRAMTVPIVDELDPGVLRFLLHAAGITAAQLEAALRTPRPSGGDASP